MKNLEHIKKATPYQDINDVLYFLAQGIERILGANLVGLYLTGSLSYGDCEEGRSDIDLAVILQEQGSPEDTALERQLHLDVERHYEKWARRIECSYIPLNMLQDILPPKSPRPYAGGGTFYPEAPYGNEWLINQYFLHKDSIALMGPDFKTLIKPVHIADVQEACIRDLHEEWEPKITDPAYLQDSHQQSYVVLNLCRILHTVMCNDAVSKRVAASWVEREYPQWRDLIEAAENWHYGVKMDREGEVIEFIRFAITRVQERTK